MNRKHLINMLEDYSKATGLKPSSICQYAIQHRTFYDKLKSGGDYRVKTGERLAAWIGQDAVERGILSFQGGAEK